MQWANRSTQITYGEQDLLRVDKPADNWNERLSIDLREPISSLSLSPANRDVVLGSRKGLSIVDLASPWDPPRTLSYPQRSAPVDVQWSIHPARSQWVLSTSGSELLLWNLEGEASQKSGTPIETVLTGHERSVTDINWSIFDPDVLASSSLDGWIRVWDLRLSGKRSVSAYSGWQGVFARRQV